jgi:hypothetical protein
VLGSDEVGSKWFSKRLYGAGSGGWSLEVAGGAFVLVEFENGLQAGERLEPCA